jgi:hypothetical protein
MSPEVSRRPCAAREETPRMKFGRTMPLLLPLILLGCTTKLMEVSTDFRPVDPVKSRLVVGGFPPSVADAVTPILSVNLEVEQLAERVETRHYRTSYAWNSSLIWFGVAGGLAGGALVANDWLRPSGRDTVSLGWSSGLMCLSLLVGLGGATRAGDPPRYGPGHGRRLSSSARIHRIVFPHPLRRVP